MARPLLCLGLLLALGGGGCRHGSAGSAPASHDARLRGNGISIRLPSGWHGAVRQRGWPLPGAVVVEVASFQLPGGDDEVATKARKAVGPDDVLVVLSETFPNSPFPREKPVIAVRTRGIDLGRHSTVEQFFIAHRRGFMLDATFGRRRPPTRLIRRVNAALATLTVTRRTQPLRPAADPPPPTALAPVRLLPTPQRVLTQCRRAAARSPFPILCPARLPRPFTGYPRDDHVPKLVAQPLPALGSAYRSRSDPRYRRRRLAGVTIGYGAPWEPDSGPDWRLHLWRNRPCCFLHFEVFWRPAGRSNIPRGVRPAVLGGRHGRLKDATSYGMASRHNDYLYWANHTRFLWQENGVAYVATLHRFGTLRETRALLGRLVRELRPVH